MREEERLFVLDPGRRSAALFVRDTGLVLLVALFTLSARLSVLDFGLGFALLEGGLVFDSF